jgi:hypothetical protein
MGNSVSFIEFQLMLIDMERDRDKWKKLAEDLAEAITNEGESPKFHRSVMKKHRSEWPTLWGRIDKIMAAIKSAKSNE